MFILPTLLGLLALAAIIAAVVLFMSGRAKRTEIQRLTGDIQQREKAIEGYIGQIESQRVDLAARDRELAQVKAQLEGQEDRFKAVAQDVLAQVNTQFQQWAVKTFQGEQKDAAAQLEQRKQAIEALVKPVRESLDRYQKSIQEVESARKEAYGSLRQQLQSLTADQQLLRKETANLVTALRRPDVRGRWGEMQLRRVAELAGMIDHCDFTEQFSVTTETGRLRPDLIVHLPADRTIVVDAKTPLDAFLNAAETDDPDKHAAAIQTHVKHIQTHVKQLSSKDYLKQFERTVDFVVMFIPGESFLQAAVSAEPQLIDQAATQNVIIATPSTLIALLKAVAMGWREQQLAENAQRIAEAGRALHERIVVVLDHAQKVGKHLDNAVGAYNSFVSSMERRLLPSVKKFEELGAGSNKNAPEIEQLQAHSREITSLPTLPEGENQA